MKVLQVTILALISLTGPLFASTGQAPGQGAEAATKLESLLLARGAILVKEFVPVFSLTESEMTLKVETLVLTEPTASPAVERRGLRVAVTEATARIPQSQSAFLDLDEIASLSRALTYMNELAAKWKTESRPYREATFSTTGGFSLGFYQDEFDVRRAYISVGQVSKATFVTGIDLFPKLRDQIDVAAAKLQAR